MQHELYANQLCHCEECTGLVPTFTKLLYLQCIFKVNMKPKWTLFDLF